MTFKDRSDAGHRLAALLSPYRGNGTVVYGLPRGGVALAAVVARHLSAPLDLLVARKVGHANDPEYAVAAVTDGGTVVANEAEVRRLDPAWFARALQRERAEAARRRRLYLKGKLRLKPSGKICIVVDDGIATGLTIQAAVTELKRAGPSAVIVAVPVAPKDAICRLTHIADRIVTLLPPERFLGSVGAHYERFEQLTDDAVIEALEPFGRP